MTNYELIKGMTVEEMAKVIVEHTQHERRLALYRQGLTDPEIARALGMSISTITNWRKRAGLKRVSKRKRKDDKYFKLIRCNDPLPPDELAVMKRRLREHFDIV